MIKPVHQTPHSAKPAMSLVPRDPEEFAQLTGGGLQNLTQNLAALAEPWI